MKPSGNRTLKNKPRKLQVKTTPSTLNYGCYLQRMKSYEQVFHYKLTLSPWTPVRMYRETKSRLPVSFSPVVHDFAKKDSLTQDQQNKDSFPRLNELFNCFNLG